MSNKKEVLSEIVDYIEESVHKGFQESEFIKEFRNIIVKYIEEKIK